MGDLNKKQAKSLAEAIREVRQNSTAQSEAENDGTATLLTGCGIAMAIMAMVYLLSKILALF
jgi:hypothetical protein